MVEYRSPKPLVRVRILVPLLEHLRELRCFFYVIGNSVGTPYYIKRHCVPESAVRGEGYIAVLSAHALFWREHQKNIKKLKKGVDRCWKR